MKAFDLIAGAWEKNRTRPLSALYPFLSCLGGREVVLDAGCGNGRNLVEIARHCKSVCGIDSAPNMLKFARKRAKREGVKAVFKSADIRNLPFKAATFDVIFCLAVLHHLKKPQHEKALQEMRRVLKPGGKLFLSVWSRHRKGKKEEHIAFSDLHARAELRYHYFFTRAELKTALEKAGFAVEEVFDERKGIRVPAREGQNLCVRAGKSL